MRIHEDIQTILDMYKTNNQELLKVLRAYWIANYQDLTPYNKRKLTKMILETRAILDTYPDRETV